MTINSNRVNIRCSSCGSNYIQGRGGASIWPPKICGACGSRLAEDDVKDNWKVIANKKIDRIVDGEIAVSLQVERIARTIIDQINIKPYRILPTADGDISIRFACDERSARIEVSNEPEILFITSKLQDTDDTVYSKYKTTDIVSELDRFFKIREET